MSQIKTNEILKKFQRHEKDTGSTEVQVALLSARIENMTAHLKVHPKDFHSTVGLNKMVSLRRSLLNYLKNNSREDYEELRKSLGLRK